MNMLAYAAIPALGLVLLGVNAASAHGMFGRWGFGASTLTPEQIASHQQERFQEQSQILGLSVDQIKDAWANGTTMQELMQTNNINETDVQKRMQDARLQQLKTDLQALVDKGVISQSQADKRLQTMQNRMQNAQTNKGFGMMRGMHGGGWMF